MASLTDTYSIIQFFNNFKLLKQEYLRKPHVRLDKLSSIYCFNIKLII